MPNKSLRRSGLSLSLIRVARFRRSVNFAIMHLGDTVKSFCIAVTGLPGSGKSTIGRKIAKNLDLLFLDKDDYLEKLFNKKGIGDSNWRQTLSRESDKLLQQMETLRRLRGYDRRSMASFKKQTTLLDNSPGFATSKLSGFLPFVNQQPWQFLH